MTIRTRYQAVEGASVRLYFRNYVSNVLTDCPSGFPTVQIRPRGDSAVLATPTPTRESQGVYYVEWAVPSSVVDSLKYRASFPGPGDYQDVWTYDVGNTLSQDFYVSSENFPDELAEIREPLKPQFVLETPRLEQGAKDFVTLRLVEPNLTVGESNFPDGEFRMYGSDGKVVIRNYTPFVHKDGSDLYRFFLDTTSLATGQYKVQGRWFIPEEIVNEVATVVSTKAIPNGFSPTTLANLYLTIDDAPQVISFPTSTSPAFLASITTLDPADLNFWQQANDLFIVEVDGTEKRMRIPNTGSALTVGEISDILTGILPTPYDATHTFPLITSSFSHSTFPMTDLAGLTMTFYITDGITEGTYTVQFNDVTDASTIAATINDAIATDFGAISVAGWSGGTTGILFLGNPTGEILTEISIVSGTALPVLGFTAGQDSFDTDGIAEISDDGSELTLTGTAGGTIRILSTAEGSSANQALTFPATGDDEDGSAATGATVSSQANPFPFVTVNPYAGTTRSSSDLEDFEAIETAGPVWNTAIDGETLVIDATTITFTDRLRNAAITSEIALGSFNVGALILTIGTSGGASTAVTFSGVGGDELSLSKIVSEINAAIAIDGTPALATADIYEGRLRIRRTSSGGYLKIAASSAAEVLGLDIATITSLDADERAYQNDQVYDSAGDTYAVDYVRPWTLTDIVEKINDDMAASWASLVGDRIVITHPTLGSGFTINVSSTVLSDLKLSSGTFNGSAGSNYEFDITVGLTTETIELADGTKTATTLVNEINSKSSLVTVATQTSGSNVYLVLTTIDTGSTATVAATNMTAITWGVPVGGTDAGTPAITSSGYSSIQFASGGYSILNLTVNGTDYIIDLSGESTLTDVATAIATGTSGAVSALATGNVLVIGTPTGGANQSIVVGSYADGSTANPALGFNLNGAEGNGTDGTPYTIQTIVDKINAAFGGYEVAEAAGSFLRLKSISEGADASIIIGSATSSNFLSALGMSAGTYIGESTTQVSQTIVSPKLNFIIGE